MSRKNCFMIIERCLSPPYRNPKKVIYSGEEIRLTDILKKLDLKSEEAKNYFYTVSEIEKKGKQLKISQGVFNSEELRTGIMSESYRPFKLSKTLELPLETRIMEGILGLFI